jgi:pimeloyl-ACP methyl ester carboxylesterase
VSDVEAPTMHDQAINGISLRYASWGAYTVPERAVLLIHGITANHNTWTMSASALAGRGWYVIAPDLRGRGLSGKPPHGYGIPYHANDMLSLCDALSLPVVNVVGHSLGAQVAIFLAAVHPGRVRRIVLVDAGGRLPDDALPAIAASLSRIGTVYPSIEAYLEPQRTSSVYRWNDYWERYYRYDAELHPDGTVTSRVRQHVLAEELAVNAAMRLDLLTEHIQAPTVIMRATVGTVAADRGFILAPEEAARMQSVIAGSRRVEVPDTNHYTIVTSDLFVRELLAFLDEERSA